MHADGGSNGCAHDEANACAHTSAHVGTDPVAVLTGPAVVRTTDVRQLQQHDNLERLSTAVWHVRIAVSHNSDPNTTPD